MYRPTDCNMACLPKHHLVLPCAAAGVLTNETALTSSPGPKVRFTDPATALQAYIRKANYVHKDIMLNIALTHIGE